ncbi:class III lanthionine synthetase LanKC N-terminal domain-containing protein [Chitinophaga arvensicola]|uniref:Serine/threonine protein kinase n=1 Tax=Chitinophaga arvensicola TaxID=29529 RepID=A0A1I0RP82_9BACT|nr:lanthionine synthetase LanC family protein [Chitinophaga arvensicola]SEW43064.1 Serine/threonine protein kinase [Chitinophaga arvensicola]
MKTLPSKSIRLNEVLLNTTPKGMVDFKELLKEFGLAFTINDFYLQVGEISQVQGWILHLSVVRVQIEPLLRILIPELLRLDVPFKIIRDIETAKFLLDAELGYYRLGKIVAVYPKPHTDIARLAAFLVHLTDGFRGPAIPTDRHLGSIVYTRYGSYNPVIKKGGDRTRYIYNVAMELIPDEFIMPYVPPADVKWPFDIIAKVIPLPAGKLFKNTYKPLLVIKEDTKGRVLKGIYMKHFLNFRHCIIKEGKRDMWLDENGRDIQDRLRWQYKLCNDLSEDIPFPKIFDLFEENGDLYLVMEFINGNSLEAIIAGFYEKEHRWQVLSLKNKTLLFKYVIHVVRIIQLFHEKGYIHRDITPANFLVDKKDRIFLIDMELSYSTTENFPDPPFKFGTPGYVSREQKYFRKPDTKQDIYAVGALLLYAFTGLSPLKYNVKKTDLLLDSIHFFTGDPEIGSLIVGCISVDPEQRILLPEAIARLEALQLYYAAVEPRDTAAGSVSTGRLTPATLSGIIDSAWKGIMGDDFLTEDLLWDAPVLYRADGRNGYMERRYLPEFYSGMSGILYAIAKAKILGYNMDAFSSAYEQCMAFIKGKITADNREIEPGLYYGLAGIGVCIAISIESGYLPEEEEQLSLLGECFTSVADSLDYANGIAGQGMALLYCSRWLAQDFVKKQLDEYVRILLESQLRNGSWTSGRRTDPVRSRNIGYVEGVPGIIDFLLAYVGIYPTEAVLSAIRKGLEWLVKLGVRRNGTFYWKTNEASAAFLISRDYGLPGIAALFINAYQQFKDPSYQRIAEEVLRYLPAFPVNENFTLGDGLSGLGEVYLKAALVFKSDEWMSRADWIAQHLAHLLITGKRGSAFWIMDQGTESVAGLMRGGCGALHFFMNYSHPTGMYPLLRFYGPSAKL